MPDQMMLQERAGAMNGSIGHIEQVSSGACFHTYVYHKIQQTLTFPAKTSKSPRPLNPADDPKLVSTHNVARGVLRCYRNKNRDSS